FLVVIPSKQLLIVHLMDKNTDSASCWPSYQKLRSPDGRFRCICLDAADARWNHAFAVTAGSGCSPAPHTTHGFSFSDDYQRTLMISKLVASTAQALADVPDGATILIGGFGAAGQPVELIAALLEQGARDL